MAFKPVYVVDGARTPFLKARSGPGPFAAGDLAVQAGRGLLLRQPYAPTDLDEVIVGCAAPSADEVNIGRVIALRLGCGNKVPGWTVMRNCASGMQALDSAIANIQTGRSQLVLAGGTDALSHAPVLFSDDMVRWLASWYAARGIGARLATLGRLRLRHLAPVIGLLKGLTDPVVGLSMGQTAENVATRFGISRQAMDAYSAQSHARAGRARQRRLRRDHAADRHPGQAVPGRRRRARGLHARKAGQAQAGVRQALGQHHRRQQLAGHRRRRDAGAGLEEAVRRWNLRPLGRIVDSQWAGLDPAMMGLGPVHAATPILQRHGLGLNDLDLWEINEAFAAQVLGCLAAWRDEAYCQEHFGTPAWGALDPARLNVDGGAIAIGHPVGASGARIVLHLLEALKRRGARRGMAAICIGGGLGGAMLVETLENR
ncbi:acetyl-CoA C-acetyltransferase [Achromobacter xylosoxidans]